MPAEIEGTLAICHEDPQRIATKLEELSVVGDYELTPSSRTDIEDEYFDTPEGAFRECGYALRIRKTNEGCFIAAKGPARRSADGISERSEVEVSWSREGLRQISEQLPGIMGRQVAEQCFRDDPAESLRTAGLVPIHRRTTLRHTRNFLDGRSGELVAELDIDRVAYYVPHGTVVHWEAEIEAKGRGDSKTVSEIMKKLLHLYGKALRRWDVGKLATGNAIEMVMDRGLMGSLIKTDGGMLPQAYDLIEVFLKLGQRSEMKRHRPLQDGGEQE